MCCKRPAWTACFFFVWALCVAGTLLMHVALIELVPALEDLPANLVKGFGEVFKFDSLEADARQVANASAAALLSCSVNASLQCLGALPEPVPLDRSSSTTGERDEITAAFTRSLSTARRVVTDKYFGVVEFNGTAAALNEVQNLTDSLNDMNVSSAHCLVTNIMYCELYKSADMILEGMGTVTGQIDKFEDSELVKKWEDYSKFLKLMHVVPYFLVLSLVFFTCFWLKGGLCCCCQGGSCASTCFLLPHAILWLVFFVLMTLVVGTGLGIQYAGDQIPVKQLNGEPSLDDVLGHIENTFPEFWAVVFEDLVRGLELFMRSALVFELFCIVSIIYSLCVCCRKPYQAQQLKAQRKAQTGGASSRE